MQGSMAAHTFSPPKLYSAHSSFYDRSNSTGRELLDADLSRRVLTLMQMLDMRLSSTGGRGKSDWRLELAMLYYVRNFRKVWHLVLALSLCFEPC